MREIKFRAWDKVGNVMSNISGITGLDYRDDNEYKYIVAHRVMQWNDAYLMQYTGLKDSKGVEIYFGDILNYYNKDDGTISICEVVETISNGAGVCIDDVISDLWEDTDVHIFEVIGNIYSNPDLL